MHRISLSMQFTISQPSEDQSSHFNPISAQHRTLNVSDGNISPCRLSASANVSVSWSEDRIAKEGGSKEGRKEGRKEASSMVAAGVYFPPPLIGAHSEYNS